MLGILRTILPFLNRRSSVNRFGRAGALAQRIGPKRGGIAFGSLLSLAAPFVIRKLMARRQQRAAAH